MDLLLELGYILRENPPKAFDLLLPRGSKMRRLFEAVMKGKVTDDAAAAALIYGKKVLPTDKKFLMLKRNLLRKLGDLVLIAEDTGRYHAPIVKEKFQCQRQLAIAEKLLLQNVYHNAEVILKQTLRLAEQHQLWDIQVQAYRLLRHLYGLKGCPKLAAAANEKLAQAWTLLHADDEAHGALESVRSSIKYTLGRNAAFAKLIQDALGRVAALGSLDLLEEHATVRKQSLRLVMLAAHYRQQPEEVLAAAEMLGTLFKDRPYYHGVSLAVERLYATARAQRDAQAVDAALATCGECLLLTEYEAFNRFDVQALAFELHLHQAEYTQALAVLQEVQHTPQFAYLNKTDQGAWLLRRFLLYITLSLQDEKQRQHEGLVKFMKESFKWSELNPYLKALYADKTGYGLLAQLIKWLFQFVKSDAQLADEARALYAYTRRHFSGSVEVRTVVFMKWLRFAAEKGITPRRVQQLHELLAAATPTPVYDVCEWLPYARIATLLLARARP